MTVRILTGDCRDVLATLPEASVDAIVTDPPYGLGFMGKDWDHEVPGVAFWEAMYRVMRPGAHLLAFGGTRTFHRIGVAIEDAGFEIRDTLMWLYGSGFPKSHDVSKAIDKAAGAEREVVGTRDVGPDIRGDNYHRDTGERMIANITAPATPEAEAWQGWGTALKPAYEPIIMARKPLAGTVAATVLTHGTGALNIDACRIDLNGEAHVVRSGEQSLVATHEGYTRLNKSMYTHKPKERGGPDNPNGRWPANVLLDEDAAEGHEWSRYFYVAKASRKERNAGLDGMPERVSGSMDGNSGRSGGRLGGNGSPIRVPTAQNHHPTVKPLALMQWPVRLVTPPGGTVLDPFMGSGSTGVACLREGVNFVGIELNDEYAEIARRRIIGDAPLFAALDVPS